MRQQWSGEEEQQRIVAAATSAELRDESPEQMVPSLADRGQYIGSESTIYRVLHAEGIGGGSKRHHH